MVIEKEILPFWNWLIMGGDGQFGALPWFFVVAAALSVVSLVVGFVIAAIRYGPMKAGDLTYRVVTTGLKELLIISPRRVFALARLAVQESIRRRVLVALGVFLLILLFASWFLGTDNAEPAKLYLSFVLTATTYLVLLIALFLSAFSLPTDFKNKTIHTVVTKPVRAGEIVLGRILGFTFVGTVLLLFMGLSSYFFVIRTLNHTHDILPHQLTDIEGDEGLIAKKGQTSRATFHRHEVTLDHEGNGETESNHGHTHMVTAGGDGQVTGVPQGMFRARVPVYGKLRFKDRTGADVAKGINVGSEWTYRSFIEGGSEAAAIWTFEDVTPEKYPDGLPLELTIRVFRTYKGVMNRGISGSIVVQNPTTGKRSSLQIFQAREYKIDEDRKIPRKLSDSEGNDADFFADFVDDGKVEIWIQCLEKAQYFGVAQADCYLRPRDGLFVVNFFKGFVSIWVQMVLVTCFGVMCSTFLSGPVAMLFTLSIIVLGFFKNFILGVASGDVHGGGPVEALIRLIFQMNVTIDLEEGIGNTVAQTVDAVLLFFMQIFAHLLPDFRNYSTVGFVADGFDISGNQLTQDVLSCLAYLIGMFVIGYFFLRTREVAQ